MKIVTIGDIHGQEGWRRALDISADKYVFVGDYVDSFWVTDSQVMENLWDILEAKNMEPDKVILLMGNHDIQYLWKPRFRCSGYRMSLASELYRVFAREKSSFQFAYSEADYLWTHAGVSNTWLEDIRILTPDCPIRANYINAAVFNDLIPSKNYANPEYVNRLRKDPYAPLFWVGPIRHGKEPSGGIFWADKRETQDDLPPGINQIVGHSPVATITTHRSLDGRASITYCDTIEHGDASFFTLEI